MKNKKILIVANWKMNPDTPDQARDIFKNTAILSKEFKNIRTVVCPPFVYLSDLEKEAKNNPSPLILGAQDMFWEKSGSYTGEIGSEMLKNESYVIIGHSERRNLGETDEMISKKLIFSIKAGFIPILCIGEKARDEHGEYLHFLKNQIINSLGNLPKKYLSKLIIAYEPVWAIGKKEDEAMEPGDIHAMTIFIKKILGDIYKSKTILDISILYGGSVSPNNAKEIIDQGEVQGLLVGRASLNSKKFGEILKNVD